MLTGIEAELGATARDYIQLDLKEFYYADVDESSR